MLNQTFIFTTKNSSSTTPSPIQSHGNIMRVVFETNERNSGERGFKASFNAEDLRSCGGDFYVLEDQSLLLESPGRGW